LIEVELRFLAFPFDQTVGGPAFNYGGSRAWACELDIFAKNEVFTVTP